MSLDSTLSLSLDPDSLFEMGKLYCDRGDFSQAIDRLTQACDGLYKQRKFEKFLNGQNLLLRMYAEREEADAIQLTKEKLQDLVLKEGLELSSKTYYTLALCAAYKRQFDVSLDYLQKALSIALATDKKEDICFAIFGIAITYYNQDRLTESLKEIYNLQVFFEVLDIPELKLSAHILNANLLRKLKKYDQAIEVLWQSYDVLRETKVMTIYVNVLFSMGSTYLDAGERDLARMYLTLALKSVDQTNFKYLSRSIKRRMDELGGDLSSSYDLIFEASSNAVVEKKLGRIDFKNQFILLDLLRLFMVQPGKVFSKEDLVETVWKQTYDPAVHDNKIYVTIKRLRKMIEPDYEKPKYIFRAKNGYYINKSARILMEN